MRLMRGLLAAVCCLLAGLASAQARADRRVALVIGNASYEHIPPLPNVPNDATAMAALFEAAKFDSVVVLQDRRVAELKRELLAFADRAADADVAVLFYAGHGIEIDRVNYLIPVDARLRSDLAVKDETVSLDRVLELMAPARKLRVVILDACRENPFANAMKLMVPTRTVMRGLGRVETGGTNTLIAFATEPNTVAEDGGGRNSPFTAALVRHLATPGLDLRIALGNVRDEVMASTGSKQRPYVTSSLGGGIIAIVPKASEPEHPASGASGPVRAGDAAQAWAAAKDSSSVAVLEAFRVEYGSTSAFYDRLAEARIGALRKLQTASASTAPGTSAPPWTLKGQAGFEAARVAAPLTATEEGALQPKDTFRECAACPEMVVVPAGGFSMGSPDGEAERGPDEGPQHRVTIARPLAVGRFEVTFAEWDACVAAGGCAHRPGDAGWGRGKRPVLNVSWDDIAGQYLPWLRRRTGKPYRLLTEAEWEYAARAGTATPYGFGAALVKSQAQYSEGGWGSAGRTVEVGSFQPNAFGLYDMHGNLWEWVQDCYHGSYAGAPADGAAWTAGDCTRRVLRGGSWDVDQGLLRAAIRSGVAPGVRGYVLGFRVGRALGPVDPGRR